jgi:hypothetical protein
MKDERALGDLNRIRYSGANARHVARITLEFDTSALSPKADIAG